MSSSKLTSEKKEKKDVVHFEWTSFPFKDRPQTSALLTVFLIFFSFLLRYFVEHAFLLSTMWFWIFMTLIFLSISSYFIPSKYTFYNNRLVAKYLFFKVERPYKDFGCFYSDKLGVMLSTFKTPRRLDPFRGMSVRYSKTQLEKEELLKFLEQKIGKRF
ncbi:hypothetical protein JEZ13_08495 [bacterium]|nr:hypothetical protein [bacterium]